MDMGIPHSQASGQRFARGPGSTRFAAGCAFLLQNGPLNGLAAAVKLWTRAMRCDAMFVFTYEGIPSAPRIISLCASRRGASTGRAFYVAWARGRAR